MRNKIRSLAGWLALGGVAMLGGCVAYPAGPVYGDAGYGYGGYCDPYYANPAPVVVSTSLYLGGSYYDGPSYRGRPGYYSRPRYDGPRPNYQGSRPGAGPRPAPGPRPGVAGPGPGRPAGITPSVKPAPILDYQGTNRPDTP